MSNSNLALKNYQNAWKLKEWDYLVAEISNVLDLQIKKKGFIILLLLLNYNTFQHSKSPKNLFLLCLFLHFV